MSKHDFGKYGLHTQLMWKLNSRSWSLDEAAWIFAGFSDKDPMRLLRFSDGAIVNHGTPEYKFALEEHDRIFDIIMRSNYMLGWRLVRRGLTEGETAWKKAQYDKNEIINFVVNDLHEYEKIHIPWLEAAYEAGRIPGEIIGRPNLVLSGPIDAESTATATVTAEVARAPDPEKLFEVKKLRNQIESFHMWVYNRLQSLSVQGKPKPSPNDMIEAMQDKETGCKQFVKYKASEKLIVYWHDEEANEKEWSYDSLKRFILHHTVVLKKD